MSGAEFIAVISLGASVIQVADACHRLINRIQDYRGNSGFDELTAQLRLLCCDLDAIRALHSRQGLDSESESILNRVLQDCGVHVTKLENLIATLLPPANTTGIERKIHKLVAFTKDRRVQQILQQLEQYKRTLTLHLTVRNYENISRMPQMFMRLEETNRQIYRRIDELIVQPLSNSPEPLANPPDLQVENTSSTTISFPAAHTQPKRSECARGTCKCPCHQYFYRMIWRRCGCSETRASFSVALLGRLVTLDLDWLSSRNSAGFNVQLRCVNIVQYDSPGMRVMNLYTTRRISGDECLRLLRLLRSQGVISPEDRLDDGRGYLESLFHGWVSSDSTRPYTELAQKLTREGLVKNNYHQCVFEYFVSHISFGNSKNRWDALNQLGFDLFAVNNRAMEYWPRLSDNVAELIRMSHSETSDVFGIHALQSITQIDREFLGVQELHNAVLLGNYSKVQNLLANDYPNLTDPTSQGQTALHLAIFDPDMVKCLLQNGFLEHVEIENGQGVTPLMFAAICDCVESAKLLINAGASPFRKDKPRGLDMWMYAVLLRRDDFLIQMLSLLRKRVPASIWTTVVTRCAWEHALHTDPSRDPVGYLPRFFDAGANECFVSDSGNSFLHVVVVPAVSMALLIRNSQHINRRNSAGCTPLMVFSRRSDPDLIQQAIILGADVDPVDQDSLCALHYLVLSSAYKSSIPWVDWLKVSAWLKSGAVLLANGASPFQSDTCSCACSPGGCSPLRLLLRCAPHQYNASEQTIGLTPLILEWYLLLRETQGRGASKDAVVCWYRLQRFEELGMVHTCCTVHDRKISHPVHLEKPHYWKGYDLNVKWAERQTEEELQEAENIQAEQQHSSDMLKRDCDDFRRSLSTTNEAGLLRVLARRVVMMEEGIQIKRPKGTYSRARNDVPIGQELIWGDGNTRITACYKDDYIRRGAEKHDVRFESSVEKYLQAAEQGKFDYSKFLPATFSNNTMKLERKRLASLLLEEVQKMRDLPAEEKDWDPEWFYTASVS